MQLNLQGERSGVGSSELINNGSDDSQMVQALRKMMKKEIEAIVLHTVQQVIGPVLKDLITGPVLKDLITKVMKVEIQSAVEKYFTDRNRNYTDETGMSREKVLHLKFLDEVSSDVLTGKAIKAKGGTPIRVALFDETTGLVVDNGPESSGKVEILVLEASIDDNECNWSHEEFNSRVIGDSDKKMPHFTKSQYVCLKDGKGILSDVKFGNDKSWTKNCLCRLGVRTVGNFHGVKVKEAWSGSFMVKDSRCIYNKKRYPPLLDDELWKLDNIGKNGPPCKRLNEATILTVQDFLFLHHVDTKRLEEIADVHGLKWIATVNHAQTCVINDKKIYVYCPSSSESKAGVAFDVVGRVKGIIRDSRYVPITNLCQADKACQHNLLLSAFQNKEDITAFDDETFLLHKFPYPSSEIADINDSSFGGEACVPDLTIVGNTTNVHDPTEPEGIDMREPCEQVFEDPNLVPSSWFFYHELFENFDDNESFMARLYGGSSSLTDSVRPEAYSCQQSIIGRNYWVRALAVMLWILRARKRVTGQGDSSASKRLKIC